MKPVVPSLRTLRNIVGDHYAQRLRQELASPERLRAVYQSHFWQQPDVEKLRQFCATAAITLNAPISQISLITKDKQHAIAAYGKVDGVAEELDFSVCQHSVAVGTGLNIEDLQSEAMLCDLQVVRNGDVRSYLGVPLIERSGAIIGSLCVADVVVHQWDEVDVMMLTHLASAVLAMHESDVLRHSPQPVE